MMLGLLGALNPYATAIKAGALVLAVVSIFGAGMYFKGLQQERVIAQAEAAAIQRTQAQDKITHDADLAAAQAQTRIQTVTVETVRKVPVYVTKKSVAACPVPLGFVRLLDASARGVQPIPNAAGPSNDSPAGIGLDDAAGSVAGNYGKYQAVAQQLRDLQAWVAAQQGLKR